MPLRAPFLLAAFLSSALLFVVEPLAARLVLPTFGGAPAVWNGTLLFFQAALLVGYLLAHVAAVRLSPAAQRFAQPAFLALSLLTIPLARDSAFQAWVRDRAAQGGAGVGLLLLALAALIGLPFVALAVNSPLLQRWYATTGAKDAHRPTFLYAAGNLGSLIALLAYPLFIEPRWRLGEQSTYWRIGLFVLAILVAVCAFGTHRRASAEESEEGSPASIPDAVPQATPEEIPRVPSAGAESRTAQRLRWLALAAVPSALLMGCTTYLTSNVAPIPLLWVVPLAMYLLTFVLVYAARPFAPVKALGRIYPMLVVPLAVTILLQADKPLEFMALFHLTVFFVAAWMCHGRLAQEAPPADGLTEYWIYVSLGGALGGLFVAVVAPAIFNSLAEYPLALAAAALLRPAIPRGFVPAKGTLLAWWDDRRTDFLYPVISAALTAVLILIVKPMLAPGMTRTFLLMGVPAAAAFAAIDRPIRFGLALGVAFWIPTMLQAASTGRVLLTERSFFGVHRVIGQPAVDFLVREPGRNGREYTAQYGPFVQLVHGNTLHGLQDVRHPRKAQTYYHETGPIGKIMTAYSPFRVALVGLGVGSLATYGRPMQSLDYFEIDPTVVKIAKDPRYFTFLRDSEANVRIVLGDARLTLARQTPGYGLIVMDAFSSDSIPIHLLTIESLRMAMSKLSKGGVLAIHISNRYLQLEPVLAANAKSLGLYAQAVTDTASDQERAEGKTQSHWVAFTRSKADFEKVRTVDWGDIEELEGTRPWTDDYSNVIGVFHPDD